MRFFSPSGGVLYHWRALRHQHEWEDFRHDVEDWLNEWPASTDELLLIGPSAGYTLSTRWLKKFKIIYAFDLDPLAGWLFRLKHPGVNVRFRKMDLFWDGEGFSTARLQTVLQTHPRAAVLMSNVLGQLLLEHSVPDDEWHQFLKALRFSLRNKEWASYHDLYTHEKGEVIDHLTDGDWKVGMESRQFSWPLTERSLHLIEGVRT